MSNFLSRLMKRLSFRKRVVLIVDDSVVDRRVAQHIVSLKYSIVLAKNGHEAIALVKEKKPDLILLDYLMPELTGADVCKILKQDSLFKDIPIIILTTYDTQEICQKSLEHGADVFMTKPIDQVNLLNKISELIYK